MRFLLLASIVSLVLTNDLHASQYSPAIFQTGDSAFSSRIKFHKSIPEGEHTYLCAGVVNYLGGLSAVACEIKAPFKKYDKKAIRAIQKASKGVRLIPAKKDGAGQKVWFNFAVVFQREGENRHISTLENHLLNQKQYGNIYTSAQRIIKPTTRMCAKGITMGVSIDAAGGKHNSEVIKSRKKEPRSCTKRMLSLMLDSEYIPATHKKANVSAIYKETFSELNKLLL